MTRFKAADMGKWTRRQKENQEFIVRQSIQDLGEIAQTPKAKGGRMPVLNGILRNSYVAALSGSTSLSGAAAYVAVLGSFKMGDTFIGGWTAKYARRQEKGFVGTDRLGRTYNQPGNFFMENALMQWQAINAKNAAKVKGD